MSRLVLFAFLGLFAFASAQWGSNNQNYPQFPNQPSFTNQPQFPDMNDMCNQPGANCKFDSRSAQESSVTDERGDTTKYTRVCDDRGCYERKVSNPSYRNGSTPVSTNFILVTICAALIGVKIHFH